jgi:hypothetical protein
MGAFRLVVAYRFVSSVLEALLGLSGNSVVELLLFVREQWVVGRLSLGRGRSMRISEGISSALR